MVRKSMAILWNLISLSLILVVRSAARVVPLRTTPENYLCIRGGAPFRIALFADLHFGEATWTGWGPQQDLNSLRVMSDVLDKERPDFVIYLGDVITANNIMVKNASFYWDQALSPTRARGIPWSSIFGNHDDAPFEWPMEWFSETGIPQIHCPAANASFAVYMYFFDSGGGSYPEVISNAQVKWFELKSKEVNPDSRVPEIIFWHVPSKAYKKVAPKLNAHRHCVGSIFLEKVASQDAEMGIMEVIGEMPSVKAVFVGHNHGLDWCCPYNIRSYGYALLGIPVTVVMEIGVEELES